MKRRNFLALGGAVATLAIAGCQSVATVESTTDWNAALSGGRDAVVFGRIRWIENGQERQMEQNLFGWHVEPLLKRLEGGQRFNGPVDPGGHFRWALPPGTYVIDRINYRDPMTGNYFLVPKVGFRVAAPGRVYYIGTLRADSATKRDFLGSVSGVTRFRVEDRYAAERADFRAKTGIDPARVQKALMVQDDRLPGSFDSTAEGQAALSVLGALLGAAG